MYSSVRVVLEIRVPQISITVKYTSRKLNEEWIAFDKKKSPPRHFDGNHRMYLYIIRVDYESICNHAKMNEFQSYFAIMRVTFYNGGYCGFTPQVFAIDNRFSCKLRLAFAPDSAICRIDVTHLPIMPDEN